MEDSPTGLLISGDAPPFQTALETDDLDAIRRAPKADLHTHDYLGGDRAYVRAATGRDIRPVDAPLTSMNAMHA